MIRPAGPASTSIVSEMGMVEDEGLDSIVERDKDFDILNTILLHTATGFNVALQNGPPETEAFVFHLAAHLKERSNVCETVHDEPKLLDYFD